MVEHLEYRKTKDFVYKSREANIEPYVDIYIYTYIYIHLYIYIWKHMLLQ